MKRVSDKRLNGLIKYYSASKLCDEGLVDALTELRERRRDADKAQERERRLLKALKNTISARECVLKIIDEDYRNRSSPNTMAMAMSYASLKQCYSAIAFLNKSRDALKEAPDGY
jgi:hypothetical protein